MADIFISYAREDQSRAELLANALIGHGWSVWYDRKIPPGKTFSQEITEAISAAKCVVVLWSHQSVSSSWVFEEADNGKRRNILVPVKIDAVDPPLGFGLIQAADLTNWQGESAHSGCAILFDAITAIIGSPPEKGIHKPSSNDPESKSNQQSEAQQDSDGPSEAAQPQPDPARSVPEPDKPSPAKPRTGSKAPMIAIAVVAVVAIMAGAWFYSSFEVKPTKFASNQHEPATPETTKRATPPDKRITNDLGMAFVYIPPGTFTMGSPEEEPGHSLGETQHRVTLTQGVYMQTTEVTQKQWEAVMGFNPSHFRDCGDECPVETVSWNNVQTFIKKLNNKDNYNTYRLPTEAEWEYACRSGTTTPFAFGKCLATDKANYDGSEPLSGCPLGEYRNKTKPVGSLTANAWGLYDMHGNLYEWCSDWFHEGYYKNSPVKDPQGPANGTNRVLRGGSWGMPADFCRAASRSGFKPDSRYNSFGFRLVCLPGQ